MAIPLRQEYHPELATQRGWLAFFYGFSLLSMQAFLRSAMATVISGAGGGLIALIISVVMAVAWVGLLRRKRWAYYLYLALGAFWLASTAVAIVGAPDRLLLTDWAFDMPILGEFLITAVWLGYFLYSRRVYSVFFGASTA